MRCIVVDDFSTDNSVELIHILQKNIPDLSLIVKREEKKWLTATIILWIKNVKTDFFIVIDGDFQHPIKNISDFFSFFEMNKNLVIAQRKKIVFEEKSYRKMLSLLWNYIINIRICSLWLSLFDPLSGFFGGQTSFFQEIILKNPKRFMYGGYKFLFDFLRSCNSNQLDYWTFFFEFHKRKNGVSKIHKKVYIDFLVSFFR